MKIIRNKKEQIDALLKSLELNDSALDYLTDYIKHLEDELKIPFENDELRVASEEDLHVHQYIEITLKYVGSLYKDKLKSLGVRR